MKPRILFLIPSDYASLKKKGVLHMIFERDEFGFFESVTTVHPITPKTQVIKLNDTHTVYEFGFDALLGACKSRALKRILAPVYLPWLILRIHRLIKQEKINLIRATDPYVMGMLAWILSRMNKRLKFCISLHADYDKLFELDGARGGVTILGSRWLAKMLERFVLSHAPMVLPIRDTLADYAIRSGANPETIRVIPHGIDLTPFRNTLPANARVSFGIGADIKMLGFAGRISNENYLDDMLTMVKGLAKKRSDFVLLIAGGGNEDQRLKSEVETNSILQRHIRLLGFLSRERVIALRRVADVNICLMAGFSLIEACAAAHPVVSYDVEWHHELVRNSETGYLLPEHNVDALVDAVNTLLEQPDAARKMGNRAQELAFERHDVGVTSAIKVCCYRELLEDARA